MHNFIRNKCVSTLLYSAITFDVKRLCLINKIPVTAQIIHGMFLKKAPRTLYTHKPKWIIVS